MPGPPQLFAEHALPSSPDRRASLERIRAVGQTFADGIAAIRNHVSKPSELNSPLELVSGEPGPDLANSMRGKVSTGPNAKDMPDEPGLDAKDAFIPSRRHDQPLPQNDALKEDYDRLKHAFDQAQRSATNELTRVKVAQLETEKSLQHAQDRLGYLDRQRSQHSQRATALERVCIALRSKLAIAEERAKDADRLQEAVLARESAEIQLAELRAQTEQLRIRCSAANVFKERAEAAESSERVLREKLSSLSKELQSREALLRQSLQEKKMLKQYMSRYERQLHEKELRIARLNRDHAISRRPDNSTVPSDADTHGGSVSTSTSIENERVPDHNTTNWEQDLAMGQSPESHRTDGVAEQSIAFPEASPLLRELEQQHALLEAAFEEPDKPADVRSDLDLRERVRRLEAALNAIPSISPEPMTSEAK